MPDPNAVQSDPNATPVTLPDPNQPAPALDVAQIKSRLNLPETATDLEVITALAELVSIMQQKYDALLSDAVTLQDNVANRDLADFKDVITPETQEFWQTSLLANRDEAIRILTSIRKDNSATPPAAPQPVRVPLANRLAAAPKPMSELAGGSTTADDKRAVAIRNRAHDIARLEKRPWSEAFTRAEKEISQ